MIQYPITTSYLILQTGYTQRVFYNYDKYENAIFNKDKTELLGITTDKYCYGFIEDTPEYYPNNNEIKRFSDINGAIIIKLKDNLSEDELSNIINKINDFCGFFELYSIAKIKQENDYLLIQFDTESG